MSNRRRVIQLALPLLLVTVASGQNFDLSWFTIDGGGAMLGTGGEFEVSGTIGQPDASRLLVGGDFEVTGGFWFPQAAGACNYDGSANLFDFDAYTECVTGPSGETPTPECVCFDFDGDDDVDLIDWGSLQVSFTGS